MISKYSSPPPLPPAPSRWGLLETWTKVFLQFVYPRPYPPVKFSGGARCPRAWYIPVGTVLRAWLATGWTECRRQLPIGGEAAWCWAWAWGVVRGRVGLVAVAGLLRLPPPGCMVVAIPLASGDPPTTLFRGGPAPPKGALRK